MEFIKEKTACFTGHRAQKLPWRNDEDDARCLKTKKELSGELESAIKRGYNTFLCGMALGFDLMCAQAVLDLKGAYPDIRLVAALPCANQAERWSAKNRARYGEILAQCDLVRCVYEEYAGAECMYERNRFMVNNSSLVITFFDGGAGGTKNTLDYARKRSLEIINLFSD